VFDILDIDVSMNLYALDVHSCVLTALKRKKRVTSSVMQPDWQSGYRQTSLVKNQFSEKSRTRGPPHKKGSLAPQ